MSARAGRHVSLQSAECARADSQARKNILKFKVLIFYPVFGAVMYDTHCIVHCVRQIEWVRGGRGAVATSARCTLAHVCECVRRAACAQGNLYPARTDCAPQSRFFLCLQLE
ncbi:unnamed protein product, partial [Brenthis ino]